jgi:hypothetical protein
MTPCEPTPCEPVLDSDFAADYAAWSGSLTPVSQKEWYVSGCGNFCHHADDAYEYDHENHDYEFLTTEELQRDYPNLAAEHEASEPQLYKAPGYWDMQLLRVRELQAALETLTQEILAQSREQP